jgi:hypothetical protein
MFQRDKTRAFVFFVLACAALLFLAGGLARIHFSPPQPFIWQVSKIAPPGSPYFTFYAQSAVLALFFLVALVFLLLTPEGRKRLLAFILVVAAALICLYSIPSRQRQPEPTPIAVQSSLSGNDEARSQPTPFAGPPPTPAPALPSWMITATALGLSLLAAAGLSALAWMLTRLRPRRIALEQLSHEVQETLITLETGGDFGDAITRCYSRMSQVLQMERGLVRPGDMTPRQFEGLLTQKGLPAAPVHTLTLLFEQVRYGSLTPGEDDIQAATTSLRAIISSCQTLPQK